MARGLNGFSACRVLIALLLMGAAGVTPGAALGDTGSAVIFMYHRFGDGRFPSTNVRMDQFQAQVNFLSANGFTVVSLGALAAALRSGAKLPEKAVALTIDDAYLSVYKNAWPLLRAKGWPFTVFVSTDAVDERSRDFMTWDQIREMRRGGVTFANHTASHPHLIDKAKGESDSAWRQRITADVAKGAARLQKELGALPPLFAYPFGEYNAAVAEVVAGMGYVAFGQNSGVVGATTDLRAVPRFPVSESYGGMGDFKAKANALALPVVSMTPWSPETRDRRPELEVVLGPTDAPLDEMRCFVSGQGAVPIEWVVPGKRFKVRAARDLPVGRHKYNITVPDKTRKTCHWFSRQWVIEK